MPASSTSVEARAVLFTQLKGRGCDLLDAGSRVAEGVLPRA